MFSWTLFNRFAFPTILLAVLLTLLVLARAIWYFVSGPAEISFGDQDNLGQRQVHPTTSVEGIMRANLFGVAHSQQIEQTIQIEDTKLKLILVAIYENFEDDGRSSALIQQDRPGSKVNRYYENDAIVGVATIEEIQPDRVILNRGGNRERLSFVTSSIFVKGGDATEGEPSEISMAGPRVRPATSRPQVGGFGEFGIQEKELLERAKNSDFTIGEVGRSRAFHQLGLKQNDKIISVNNIPTENLHDRRALQEALSSNQDIQVDIQRGEGGEFSRVAIACAGYFSV